jgi:hypothetical protein
LEDAIRRLKRFHALKTDATTVIRPGLLRVYWLVVETGKWPRPLAEANSSSIQSDTEVSWQRRK